MRMLSLFSGGGGIDKAAEWAGIETVAMCEIEPYCVEILKLRYPGVPIYGDVRELTAERLRNDGIGPIDIICGGFPCQPFSQAGQRRGTEDDRYLWPEMLRIIKEVRPTWFVGENVAGIVSMAEPIGDIDLVHKTVTRFPDSDVFTRVYTQQEIMLLGNILKDIEEAGYEVQPFLIPASGVEAPHERYRTFLVAYAAGS
jgi:DNA (cytosine-5)-methyltransferase 1